MTGSELTLAYHQNSQKLRLERDQKIQSLNDQIKELTNEIKEITRSTKIELNQMHIQWLTDCAAVRVADEHAKAVAKASKDLKKAADAFRDGSGPKPIIPKILFDLWDADAINHWNKGFGIDAPLYGDDPE